MTWRPVKDIIETGWYWWRVVGVVELDPVYVWRWLDGRLMFSQLHRYGPLEDLPAGAELYGPLTPPE